jgi:glutamine amidotransferase
MQQSEAHPDGWGVAYYVGQSPHLIKSASTALNDNLFKQVSGIVSSETVVAHIRRSTQGENTILNTHPFQFGKWVFAHNGNIKDFNLHRHKLLEKVDARLQRYVLGDTDSEILFFIVLSFLSKRVDLHRYGCRNEDLVDSIREAIDCVSEIVGDYVRTPNSDPQLNYFTFLITNGQNLVAFHGGKEIHYSTFKNRCSERSTCASFAPECESATQSGYVNHLIISSEPLSGQNIWLSMKPGEIVGADWNMRLHLTR